ncbi:MAG TPA: N-acetylmuramoyl-L-alanine amidase [Marmoricola sp.]
MSRWALRTGAGVLGIALTIAAGAMLRPVHSPVPDRAGDPVASTPMTPSPSGRPSGRPSGPPSGQPSGGVVPARPLAGLTIALDPGHQLGNRNFPEQMSRLVPAGGFRKPCNTSGTATTDGIPEATVVWRVVRDVQSRLRALGATVRLTRTSNSDTHWGPCVDARGRFGGRVGARLEVSVHADGAPEPDHGFHVIAPARLHARSRAVVAASLRLAKALRGGFDRHRIARSDYIGGGTALSIRSDLATLNLATVPAAMLEIGNMANPADARRMTTASGQQRYAEAIVEGIRRFLRR